MDRGAARSRKRAHQHAKPAAVPATPDSPAPPRSLQASSSNVTPVRPAASRLSESGARRPSRGGDQSKDPSLYRAKAVRSSASLSFKDAPFPIPPTKEALATVKRIDLTGSGVKDVSWLEGTAVSWLSLAGCEVTNGWEAVGALGELAVLNISGCGLKGLPKPLTGLGKLKALVAMNNEWEHLDEDVVGHWPRLNSLIVSHSPHLRTLPSSLGDLSHLSKLTFSHCPALTGSSLPDLSALPLLRDVKMNNLPHLTSLPPNIARWGTGEMTLVGKGDDEDVARAGPSNSRKGDGLEVLDLGNCSLPFEAISSLFGLTPKSTDKASKIPRWRHLRSLSLHSNPHATSHPHYAELLQAAPDLPNLQIIDAKRVKERKRKGAVQETKLERRRRKKMERKMRPSGANETRGKMRAWGGHVEDGEGGEEHDTEGVQEHEKKDTEKIAEPSKEGTKKRKRTDEAAAEPQLPTFTEPAGHAKRKRHKKSREGGTAADALPIPPGAAEQAEPTVPPKAREPTPPKSRPVEPPQNPTPATKPRRNETSVVGVIEVPRQDMAKKEKSKKEGKKGKVEKGKKGESEVALGNGRARGGVDLKKVFGKASITEAGTGLGVGGW